MSAVSEKSIKCAICLDPLKDPLALPCGHSYCRDCIQRLFKLPQPEPISREDFLRYARDITLDPNTVHPHLVLSDGNRRLTRVKERQSYPDHPDRFDELLCALSEEQLTGRCYWEVECSEIGFMKIAVSYKDIHRKCPRLLIDESWFGCNDKSWVLECGDHEYRYRFNSVQSDFFGPVSRRFGVYLDHSAGVLSFYSVQDQTMTLLHKVQTVFTKPLHAGVALCCFGTAHFPKLR